MSLTFISRMSAYKGIGTKPPLHLIKLMGPSNQTPSAPARRNGQRVIKQAHVSEKTSPKLGNNLGSIHIHLLADLFPPV